MKFLDDLLRDTMVSNLIAYTMDKLKKEGIYRRTYVQKIMYFILPEELRNKLYIPYLYGPYSPDIQRVIQFLEQNPEYINEWITKIKTYGELKNNIDKLIDLIKKENISVSDISYIAKIHYIKMSYNPKNHQELKEYIKLKSAILGWPELRKLKDEEIEILIKKLNNLQETLQKYT